MAIFRWGAGFDPFAGLRHLHRELERLNWPWPGQARTVGGGVYPPVNVHNCPEDVVIQCEVAGVRQEDLDVSITGETLTIKGVKQPGPDAESVRFVQQERGFGEFTRTIVLPDSVEPDRIEARLRDGILTVRLPKKAQVAPKQIEVKS